MPFIVDSLQTQLRSPPVSSLGVVPDFVASFHPNPLRNRTILLLFLSQESLDSESLVRRHGEKGGQTGGARWRRKGEEKVPTRKTRFTHIYF